MEKPVRKEKLFHILDRFFDLNLGKPVFGCLKKF